MTAELRTQSWKGALAGEHIIYDLARNHVSVVRPNGKTKSTFKQP